MKVHQGWDYFELLFFQVLVFMFPYKGIIFIINIQLLNKMDEQPKRQLQPQPILSEQNGQNNEDLDQELQQLELFHQSSLRNEQQIPLPIIVNETFTVKKYTDQHQQMRVNHYIEMSYLGKGQFATVNKVRLEGNGCTNYFAMKTYSLMRLRNKKFCAADGYFANGQQMLKNQIQILKRLKHKNLSMCQEIMYQGNYVYFVMQLCDLGQIMTWSEQKDNFVRNPKVIEYLSTKYQSNSIQQITRLIFLQVALGLQYLHKNNITNRDIKVENILCKTVEGSEIFQDIKIADFTTVRHSIDDISYFTCGTPGFRGPELLNAADGYSCKALDVWSMGISMYTYYYEMFPFMGESQYIVETRSEKQQLKFDENCPKWLSNLISNMTKKNWKHRISIDEIVNILSN